MKRLVAGFAFLLASTAVAATFSLADVNLKIAELVRPYNSATSAIKFEFTKLTVDAVRATGFGLTTEVSRTGAENDVKLTGSANYDYLQTSNGPAPTFDVDLQLELPVARVLGQDMINQLAESLDQLVLSIASEYTQKYGDAVTMDARILNIQRDAAGNVTQVGLAIDANFDLSLLPPNLRVEDVELKRINVQFAIDGDGIQIKGGGIVNPAYKGFAEDQVGLKELIEKLLSDDQETWTELGQSLGSLVQLVDWIATVKL